MIASVALTLFALDVLSAATVEHAGKACANAYTKVGKCDGWKKLSKETCIQYCKENKSPNPEICPAPEGGCRYAMINENGGWCQLTGNTCDWKDRKKKSVIVVDTKEPERCGYIQHFGGYCLHPLGGKANPPPGTQVILHPGCKDERLYFCTTPQHELKHKGSGLCIVPQSTNIGNGVKLVLNQCGSSAAKFRVTAGGSIQHMDSGKCWHPLGGKERPSSNTAVVLHDGCDDNRLKFTHHS